MPRRGEPVSVTTAPRNSVAPDRDGGARLCLFGHSGALARDRPDCAVAHSDQRAEAPDGPPCGVKVRGGRKYLASPPTANPILLVGAGARGRVPGARSNGDICQTLPFAEQKRACGYYIAVFDRGSNYPLDKSRATQASFAAGAHRVVVVGGFSVGALVALRVASRLSRQVVDVISFSGEPSASEGLPAIYSLSEYHGPILLIRSKDDPVFPLGTSAAIAAADAGREKFFVVPGRERALALLDGPSAPRIYAAIHSFLARVL
jgi:hypothetical protein